jgi:hypothetical protein
VHRLMDKNAAAALFEKLGASGDDDGAETWNPK